MNRIPVIVSTDVTLSAFVKSYSECTNAATLDCRSYLTHNINIWFIYNVTKISNIYLIIYLTSVTLTYTCMFTNLICNISCG